MLSALFVFAHPDDEFFCLPAIQRELALNHRAICLYLTDGSYGGQSAQKRVDESTTALTKRGVPESDIHFIGAQEGIPDGKLHLHLDLAYRHLSNIAESHALAEIYCPAWEGGHQDHDACYALSVSLAGKCNAPLPLQFSLYNSFHANILFNVMRALEKNGPVEFIRISWKEAFRNVFAVAAYPSQWKTWVALLPFAAIRILATRRYLLQRASTSRLFERPHEGKLLYERRKLANFSEIKKSVMEFLRVAI